MKFYRKERVSEKNMLMDLKLVGKGHRIWGYVSVLSLWLGLATPKVRNKNGCNTKKKTRFGVTNATF